jgi:hypothetical protein
MMSITDGDLGCDTFTVTVSQVFLDVTHSLLRAAKVADSLD